MQQRWFLEESDVRGRRREIAETLLRDAGINATIDSAETVGIGTAGLNSRGPRDEDGTHTRLHLGDGNSVIFREYATTSRTPAMQQHKETVVLRTLQGPGLPIPKILALFAEDHAATLLSDPGGDPLEEVFLKVPTKSSREALWSEVGSVLRKLHEVDTSSVRLPQTTTRAWLDFLPYFIKSLRGVKKLRPDLAPAVDEFVSLRRPLQDYLDERPKAITVVSAGGNLPGMMIKRDGQRWRVVSWLSLGYYVNTTDPARDVVAVEVNQREWTGEPLPAAFYRSYGSRPDPICALVYAAFLQVGHGAVYQRGPRRPHPRSGDFPPAHSVAIKALEEFPQTVKKLRSMLEARASPHGYG